ncbi:MAG TPA: DUF1804 family protein [Aliidongia sp.]|uniref:DUF1804 family protein n=1 Tax=Aliidongia sp. TaxID=1914230 RepID=UPI002DDD5B51|nr:DUF1804 family protein [Aliidongia sp.]HEV2678085.1 DUF1804 family protein [Aliidongia sp.]
MAHAPEKRALVRAAYVHERVPIEVAAHKAAVSMRTASRWKSEAKDEGDDWDRGRTAARMAGEGFQSIVQAMLEDFVSLHRSTMQDVRDDKEISPLAKAEALSRLADAFTKTMGAAAKASPELSRLAIAMEVIRLFGEFVRKRFPRHAPAFVEVLEPFAEALAAQLG